MVIEIREFLPTIGCNDEICYIYCCDHVTMVIIVHCVIETKPSYRDKDGVYLLIKE